MPRGFLHALVSLNLFLLVICLLLLFCVRPLLSCSFGYFPLLSCCFLFFLLFLSGGFRLFPSFLCRLGFLLLLSCFPVPPLPASSWPLLLLPVASS
jgi:hypothetical protein